MGRQDRALPSWAVRIRRERTARGWSQRDAVRALLAHGDQQTPTFDSVLRRWKDWEAGAHHPDGYYQGLLAQTFGTVRRALFPEPPPTRDTDLIAVTGMDTVEILARIRASDLDASTLDALEITVDRLCSDYQRAPADDLLAEARQWLSQVASMMSTGRLTLAQHREVLTLSGWLALLVGCVEYDLADRGSAEATRRAASSLGQEARNADIEGWAQEMRAWFALTSGDLQGVINAARAGMNAAKHHSVTVQLAAQEAKAWARLGDRRQVELALERGRRVLEELPYPENIRNHFVVDPAKYDFYAMDCYRILREDAIAESLAEEVIRAGTDAEGMERSPMRNAEARVTLGVLSGRAGDLEGAVSYGLQSLDGERKSVPHLLMASRELAGMLRNRYGDEHQTREYIERLQALGEP